MGKMGGMCGQIGFYCFIGSYGNASLVCPETGNIPRSVTAAAQQKKGSVQTLYEGNALAVSTNVQVETAKSIASKAVSPTLQNDGARVKILHTWANNVFKQLDVVIIFNSVVEWNVQRVMSTRIERVFC